MGLFTLAMMRCLEDIHFNGPAVFLRSVGLGGLDSLGGLCLDGTEGIGLDGLLWVLQQAHTDLVAAVTCVEQEGEKPPSSAVYS